MASGSCASNGFAAISATGLMTAQTVPKFLQVEATLSGRVERRGENGQISIEFFGVSGKIWLWSEQYTRLNGDLTAL